MIYDKKKHMPSELLVWFSIKWHTMEILKMAKLKMAQCFSRYI